MSLPNGQPGWSTSTPTHINGIRFGHHVDDAPTRTLTPIDGSSLVPEASLDAEEESRRAHFTDLFRRTEDKISLLFAPDGSYNLEAIDALRRLPSPAPASLPPTTDHEPIQEPPRKKAKRSIDEDDYDDEDEDEDVKPPQSVTKAQGAAVTNSLLSPSKSGSSPGPSLHSPTKQLERSRAPDGPPSKEKAGETDDGAIKSLQEDQKAAEEAAKRNFHTIMYILENDRTAMLEQQQLEDSEKQLQAEMDHNGNSNAAGSQATNQGSLSSANLGASSLTLKHLIARIDMKRDQVRASDAELRLLMNEVRKNRSKWASEENVNQEELYDALEKVLTELKAHTEYSTPFLTRVNKRDAPDYYNFIKNPMDLGTMTKKLKQTSYKSKAEFVTDLNLIWDNCLKYNQDMNHPLRRMANGMRKEAEKLIPLIPDLTIRSRAEVEAEERRKQNGGEDDAGDDSDDEPIMSSRGRKAATKGANKSRKAPSDEKEDTPVVDQKPILQLNGLLAKSGREGSEIDGSNGFATPPIGGSITPGTMNGHAGAGSNADAMDIDGPILNGMALNQAFGEAIEQAHEGEEYKIWKQTTKKDRAIAAKERFLLFKDGSLNTEAPALLRSKAGMRRVLKHQIEAETFSMNAQSHADGPGSSSKDAEAQPSETLADGIEEETEQLIPDYYLSTSNIPDVQPNLQWIEDGEGQVVNQHGEFLRLVPSGLFTAPRGRFAKKMDENIRQIQQTRKLAAKISLIKQIQLQTQFYNNQFLQPNMEPFVEQDIEPHFIADDGPVMAPEACQDAFKRSIAKILYSSGFEELQPSAVDAFTGLAADYFEKLVKTLNSYRDAEGKSVQTAEGIQSQPRFTPEEMILHTLDENGTDIPSLESYAKDEVDRLSGRLGTLHERMKLHLNDLLRRPEDVGPEGTTSFKDGSEQFVSGDFADDLGEDFFGFRALGIDKEMGLDSFTVPFHLLQSKIRNQFQMQTQNTGEATSDLFDAPESLEPVTKENIQDQIGLVKNFFLAKLHANDDQPLIEDEDLPVKQRKPRPRLGATGKILTAQKRSPKEQLALAKKKKKMEAAAAEAKLNATPEKGGASANNTPAKKKSMSMPNGTATNPAFAALAPSMERTDSMQSQGGGSMNEREDGIAMMSPESMGQ